MYVRNLEERVKPEPLKEALGVIFSEFGTVIDIVAKTNLKAKGQAFVVYDNPESARRAIEETDGFDLFDKPIQVALARTRSDATVQRFENDEALEQHKRHRTAEKGACTRLMIYIYGLITLNPTQPNPPVPFSFFISCLLVFFTMALADV